MKKKYIWLVVIVLGIFFYWVYQHRFFSWLTLEKLQAENLLLKKMVHDYPFKSALIFMAIFSGALIFCLPVTPLLTVVGGAFFGVLLGTLYSVLAAVGGATISLYSFRYLLRDAIYHQSNKRLLAFQKDFDAHGFSYLVSLMLFPGTPFVLITMLAGTSHVPLSTFIAALILSVVPGTVVYAYAGKEFTTLHSVQDVLSWHFFLLFALLAVASSMPVVVEKYRAYRK